MRVAFISCAAVLALSACTEKNPEFCDESTPCEEVETPVCDLDHNRCVADSIDASVIDSGGGFIDAAVGVDAISADAAGGVDAGVEDASVDAAPPAPTGDIAYANGYSILGGTVLSASTRIINTSAAPLSLSSLEVVSVSHDGPAGATVAVEVATSPLSVTVPAGQSAGLLIGEGAFQVGPLVPETAFDETTDILKVDVSGLIVGDPSFTITAVVRMAGRQATLLMSVAVPSGATFGTIVSGDRTSAIP